MEKVDGSKHAVTGQADTGVETDGVHATGLDFIARQNSLICRVAFLDQNLTVSQKSLVRTTLSRLIPQTRSDLLSLHVLKLLEVFHEVLMIFTNFQVGAELLTKFSSDNCS
jgi:hypothetical protein